MPPGSARWLSDRKCQFRNAQEHADSAIAKLGSLLMSISGEDMVDGKSRVIQDVFIDRCSRHETQMFGSVNNRPES